MRVWMLSVFAATAALCMSPLLVAPDRAAAQPMTKTLPTTPAPSIDPRELDRRKAEEDARRAAEERARRAADDAAFRAGFTGLDVKCRVQQVRLQEGILMIGCMDRVELIYSTDPRGSLNGPNFYLPVAEDPVLAQLALTLASDAYHADAVIRFKGSRRRDAAPVLNYGDMYRLSFVQAYRSAD